MDYSQFFNMIPEAGLMAILVIVFLADLFMKGEKKHATLSMLTCVLLVAQVALCFTAQPAEAFAGLYTATAAAQVMKVILTAGAFIVVVMAQSWIERGDVLRKEGEFYELVISTLLGMYMMISSGHFLMFFLGLEMASVPMACLVAFDKYKKESAEGAAKFVLTATFSSGVMLYGISFLYGACGTLYFADMAAKISATPLTIMGLVFFFSGLGFKISLVPFHFWTADTYQGAPTAVTGYLSVVSKGAAAFALMTILLKVFGPMVEYYETLMYYVLIYVAANMAVFTVINVVETRGKGNTEMSVFDGFYTTNPKLSFLLTLALFSLAGIPPFAGMFCKFFVFMAAAQQGTNIAYAVVFLALVNTVPSLYYYLKIVKCMYINKTDTPLPTFQSDCATRTALALCTAGVLLFGVCSCVYGWLVAATSAM